MSTVKLISEKSEFVDFLDECGERHQSCIRLALLDEECRLLLVNIKQLQKRVEILIDRFDLLERM